MATAKPQPSMQPQSWPGFNPSQLRHQVTIQQKSTTPTPTGSPQAAWSTVLTCWAGIMTLASKEAFQTGGFSGQMTHRISIRWPGPDVAITAGMQVLFGSRAFTIQAPPENVQERNVVLHLLCLELS
jgi:SPP1 family predicted phage head-tail adaptor